MNDHGTSTPDSTRDLDRIPGWFFDMDRTLFRFLLQRQLDLGQQGGLVELGCYLGKSTVVMGDHLREGEDFTVVDLFEAEAGDEANTEENNEYYASLTRQTFESNYLMFHDKLPRVVTDFSSAVTGLVPPGSARFIHVDASHLYQHVAVDVDSARQLITPEGIVVLDDFRSEHTPGVAAAAWEAVLNKGLVPVALTECKMYGTWGDPTALRDDLREHLISIGARWESQEVAGHTILRWATTPARPSASSRATKVAAEQPAAADGRHKRTQVLLRERETEIRALRDSVSFRLGRALTAPARRLRRR